MQFQEKKNEKLTKLFVIRDGGYHFCQVIIVLT